MLIQNPFNHELRHSGIEVIGDTSWGTHFCNFFETKQDMLDILLPFFKAGLEQNEYCVFITDNSISAIEAVEYLRKGIEGFEKYYKEKRIEIIAHTEWYLKKGMFDSNDIFEIWDEKLKFATDSGFEGLRINGNATWLERNTWDSFLEYEEALNDHISDKKIIVMCTYQLDKCIATDVLDVAHVHKAAISKRRGKWEVMEVPEMKQSNALIMKSNELLKTRIMKGTRQLKEADSDLKNEILEHIITEKALKKSEANLMSIFENTGTALILMDTEFNVLLFNDIADQLSVITFGKTYSNGESMLDMIQKERRNEFKFNCETVFKGNKIVYDTSYPVKDGSVKWYNTRMFPVIDEHGKCIGICISAEDITERKNTELEKEKITFDLVQRNKDLEQFSYMVSHNLRAPVANILGFSKMVIENKYNEEKKKIFIEQIYSSARILDEVIRDLNVILQVKTESHSKKDKVQFISIIENIKKTITHTIEKENAVIKTNFLQAEDIFGNRVYLYSIFLNLISNSIKYHQPGIPPIIEITTYKENNNLFIVFKDNGLGINLNKNRDKVFGLYKRFHADIEGKGMGLFMVKTQVNILGGKISIESKVNQGSIFTIELNQ